MYILSTPSLYQLSLTSIRPLVLHQWSHSGVNILNCDVLLEVSVQAVQIYYWIEDTKSISCELVSPLVA